MTRARLSPSRPGRAVVAIGGLAAVLAALLVTALVTQRSERGRGAGGAAAPVPAPERPGALARVTYAGPHGRLGGPVTFRAHVRRGGQHIVAVTFLLDGRPLGTDTVAPYRLDADAGDLPPGGHGIQVQAVDRLGRRTTSPVTRVHLREDPSAVLRASPSQGLDQALAALARGHVTVALAPGRYSVPAVRLGSGARLRGAGSRTVLTPATGAWALLTVHGAHVRVADLSVDGLGRVQRAVAVAGGSRDVRLSRLQLTGMTVNGVEMDDAHHDVSVQDSTITGRGAYGAGVLDLGSDSSSNVSVVRCVITGFRAFGINFAQRAYGSPRAARYSLALDNRISDIQDPSAANGTHEGGIWSGGVKAAIIGNQISHTGWDGIETVGSSTGDTVVDNQIVDTRTGIYLEHETDRSLFAGNRIQRVITGINVEWRFDHAGSEANAFTRNRIDGATQTGLFVDVASDRNRITDNVFARGRGNAIVLQGSSDNLVTGNRACARGDDPVLRLQSAHFDNGTPANSLRNRVADNRSLTSCAGL